MVLAKFFKSPSQPHFPCLREDQGSEVLELPWLKYQSQEAFCFQEHRGTGIRNEILEPQGHAWRLEGAASSCVGLGSLCEESLDVVEALTGRAL